MTDTTHFPVEIASLMESSPRVIMIDGRSGAGKTTLAEQLAGELDAQVLHMDDLYRGWNGLLDAPERLETALAAGQYRTYDWAAGRVNDTVKLAPQRPLIIEGCGSITAGTLAAARAYAKRTGAHLRDGDDVVALWLECPTHERKARALARDGDMFRPHWDDWAAQEERLLQREHSHDIADVRLDTLCLAGPEGTLETD